MGLLRDMTSGGRGPPVINLTTSRTDPLSPLSSLPNNNNSSSSNSQNNQQQHQTSSSSPSMPQQEDTVIDPIQAQGSKKKNKKKKKKAIASTDPSLAPDESTTPPAAPSAINEQEEMLNKESLDWLDGVVQSGTKPASKKSKSKKKAAAVATAEASAEVATGKPSEQAGFKASQAHFDDERNYVAQAPVNVGDSVEPSHNEYDIHSRQVLYAVAASGNDDLSFLNNDFMNTATSNWADDIDEYEQNHIPPNSIATAAPPATSAASLSTSTQQAPWKDSAPRNLVYKGPIVTKVATVQSQDARFSSAPDTRRSYGRWEPAPQPFKAQPGHDFSEQHSDYHQRPYGKYSARPADYHQPPPSKHQPGMPHRPLMSEPPAHSHQRPMSGPPFQHQTYYSGQPQGQLRPPHPQPASQQQKHQQQHQQQRQRHLASPGPAFGSTQAQVSLMQSKAGDKADKAKNNADNAWQSIATTKPKNASHLSTKPAWVSCQGSHDDQGPAESKQKPEVERNKSATTSAALVASLQIPGEPKNKRATGPGMGTATSPQPPSHASQKNKHKKQEQRRSFSLSTQSQEKSQSLTPTQMESQAHVEPPDQQSLMKSDSEQLQHLQHLLFYDALPPLEGVKDFELPWLASSKAKTGPEPWADRNKVIEFFSKRWVEARMSSGGHGPDAAVVYCSSP
ncbi:hypothetical protein KI688_002622 [Linnemannia hyalina]|uniref:Uncharacterized protein n=1 Tax=Linnemannia hyalina TaxID=64524 RepID=A0A9P7XRI2_9FUNG|nr:hypothetical protein KI688_002622 [Linnemannia hyalina]